MGNNARSDSNYSSVDITGIFIRPLMVLATMTMLILFLA